MDPDNEFHDDDINDHFCGLGGGGENEARVAAVGGDNFIPSVEDEEGSDVDSCDSSKG